MSDLTIPAGEVIWPYRHVHTSAGGVLAWAEPNLERQVRYRIGAGGVADGRRPNQDVYPCVAVLEEGEAPTLVYHHPHDVFGSDTWPDDLRDFGARYSLTADLTPLELPYTDFDPRVEPNWLTLRPDDLRIPHQLAGGYASGGSSGPVRLRAEIYESIHRWLTTEDAWRFYLEATIAVNVWALKVLQASHPEELEAAMQSNIKPLEGQSRNVLSGSVRSWRGRPSALAGRRR